MEEMMVLVTPADGTLLYSTHRTSDGVGLNKMFAALPKEEKGVLRTTYFVPLLLIDPLSMMSMLVMEIFDRHLGDMKRCSSIKFVKNYTIISHPEQGKKRWGERNHIEAPTIGDAPTIEPPAIDVPIVSMPVVGSSSSATEIRTIVVRQVAPEEGLDVVKDLMVDDDVEVGREVNLKAISSEYGGDLLEMEDSEQETVVVYYDGKKDVVEEANEANTYQTTAVSFEEQTMEVAKTEDEASQTKKGKDEVKQSKEEVAEGKDDDDGNSQKKPDPVQLVLMESEVNVTLKKSHTLSNKDNNEKAFKMACQMNLLYAHLDELLPGVLLESFIQRPISQDEKNQVIDVYIKALIQYFGTQHRVRSDKEKIVLTDVYSCQYIGRAFNVWTNIMSSLIGVELKKKLIWEQITSMKWDRSVFNYFHREDLKVVNSKLILISSNRNDNHWVLYSVSFKGRNICICDLLVDAKIIKTKKKKLYPGYQRIEDQLSKILPKILIWTDFADRSSPPTGSEVKTYGLNSK
ncbi:hypothetical protein GIB67_004760 [Kingdonia uniflora]|uniref:Ubiquitin-like protease family profile domain-containing protein n=1 Tax=Kingdonia uniflora TaxID=39325 RepID=A0A7J7NQN3_9MAGN|nr:hypothetical protein GIB67_004760 [Kingdonia uniflora]